MKSSLIYRELGTELGIGPTCLILIPSPPRAHPPWPTASSTHLEDSSLHGRPVTPVLVSTHSPRCSQNLKGCLLLLCSCADMVAGLAGSCLNAQRLVYFCNVLIKVSVYDLHLHHHPCTCLKVEVPRGEDDGLLWNCRRNLPEEPSGLPHGWELSELDRRRHLPSDTQCVRDRADTEPLTPGLRHPFREQQPSQ